MKRVTAVALACALALAVSGCNRDESPPLELTGSVVDAITVVAVPPVPDSSPDPQTGRAEATATPTAVVNPAVAASGTRWARIAHVSVRPGDQVTPGQELARVDDTFLRLAVATARTGVTDARARITLLDERLSDVSEGRSELSTKAADLDESITELESERADVANQLAAAKAALAASTSATETAQLAPQVTALETALAQLEAGLEQARTGRSQLASATAELDTAQTAITGLRTAAKALLEAREIGVSIAERRLDDAVVLAPAAGTIIDAPIAGAVLAEGAPLVTMRVSSATRVETYVTADVARRIMVGTQALVMVDALPGRGQPAHVVSVGERLEFVPTTFATEIIHLSRAIRIEVELDGTRWIAPGTPADVELSVK